MLHVVIAVIAVIRDKSNQVLIAQRAANQHQGGKWEFSGGKVEAGESAQQALTRELNEELGIQVNDCMRLIQIQHHYNTCTVFLDVYEVTRWQGEVCGKEGQPIRWVKINSLNNYDFPRANTPILQALMLPDTCLITPEIDSEAEFQQGIRNCLDKGITLIQFRAKTLPDDVYIKRAQWLIAQCKNANISLVLNSPPAQLALTTGLHLTSSQLLGLNNRPKARLLSAACHNKVELLKAQQLKVDFIFLSPIKTTLSHPEANGKGWQWFQQSINNINIPIYALGGLGIDDIETARQKGGQGIAAISQLW
jgi:8-oxo-dGTP diphosphatase